MLIGLLAGAVAAVIAALLSLPLHSPDDILFNTATVTASALVAGVAAAALRRALPLRGFALVWGLAFAGVLLALAAGESQFARMLQFGAPVAAVVFATTGLLVGALAGRRLPMERRGAAAVVGLAVVLGIGLAGRGDAESGRLVLPPAPAATAPSTASPSAAAPGVPTSVASAPAAGSALPAQFAAPADLKGVTFVVGDGSQATFTVTEKLVELPLPNQAVVKGTALTGDIHFDGRPSTITINLQKLSSDQPRRDNFARRTLFGRNPTAVLTVDVLPSLPDRYQPGQVVKAVVSGTLAINGVQRPVSFDVEARLDGTTLNVVGRTAFVWKDFDYTPPNVSGVVQVQDRVTVEVLIVARAQGR